MMGSPEIKVVLNKNVCSFFDLVFCKEKVKLKHGTNRLSAPWFDTLNK